MNRVHIILKNFLSLSVAGVVTKLLAVVAVAYLARVLGPRDFGKVSFAQAVVSYFAVLGTFGLDTVGIRELARAREEQTKVEEYAGNIIGMKLCLRVFSYLLLLLFAAVSRQPSQIRCLFVLYGLSLIGNTLIDWVFQGLEQMEYNALSVLAKQLLYVGTLLAWVRGPDQLLYLPLIEVASGLIATGILLFAYVRLRHRVSLKIRLPLWKMFAKQAWPIALSNLMIVTLYYFDTVVLGFVRTKEEVGYYNAAYKIIWLLVMFIAAYHDAIFPVASHYYKTSLASLQRLLSYTAKLTMVLAIPLAVGGTILARPIMTLIYGSQYEGGVVAFQILMWVVLAISLNTIYARGLWACDKQGEFLQIVAVQVGANLVLNFALIPPFGIVGAGIATFGGELIGFPLYYRALSRITSVQVASYMPKPVLASLLMMLFLLSGWQLWSLNVFILALGGIAIYLASLYIVGGITDKELRLAHTFIMSMGEANGRTDIEQGLR